MITEVKIRIYNLKNPSNEDRTLSSMEINDKNYNRNSRSERWGILTTEEMKSSSLCGISISVDNHGRHLTPSPES